MIFPSFAIEMLLLLPVWARFCVLVSAAGVFGFVGIEAFEHAERTDKDHRAFLSYMHECVPRLTEQRCAELWRWR